MARRTHSKINRLEPAVKETVDEMIKSGEYYRDIVDYIKSHGVSISVAAVGKYAKNLMSTLDALRMTQENFRAIMDETERYPDLDMTEGILRIVSNRLMTAINEMPESEITSKDLESLIKNTSALTRAVVAKKRADVQNKDVREIGLEQFKSALFDLMAEENPKLYKENRKFIKKMQEKLS